MIELSFMPLIDKRLKSALYETYWWFESKYLLLTKMSPILMYGRYYLWAQHHSLPVSFIADLLNCKWSVLKYMEEASICSTGWSSPWVEYHVHVCPSLMDGWIALETLHLRGFDRIYYSFRHLHECPHSVWLIKINQFSSIISFN